MPCKEYGCNISDYCEHVDKMEEHQCKIDYLYSRKPIPKGEIRELKIKRDKLLENVLFMLEKVEYWVGRLLLRDRNIPINWRDYERLNGEEYAEATD